MGLKRHFPACLASVLLLAAGILGCSGSSSGGSVPAAPATGTLALSVSDAATEDWEDCAIQTDALWLARRTTFRRVGRWPRLYDRLRMTTFCAGVGAAWAERRTDLYCEGELAIVAASLWVPVDPRGFPVRIPAAFHEIFGEAMGGRRVSARVPAASPPTGAPRRAWPLRRADLDVIGHVNNTAVWQAVSDSVSAQRIRVVWLVTRIVSQIATRIV